MSNYRDLLWIVILSVGVSAPFLLLSSILLVALLVALLFRKRSLAVAAIIAASMSFLGAIYVIFLHPDPPLVRTTAYTMLTDLAFRAVLTIPTMLLGIPVVAMIMALRQAFAKRWKTALRFAVVPIIGGLLFWLSVTATGLLTLWSCVGPIQSALHTVERGGTLPHESQQYPVAVFRTKPDIAVEALDSFMDTPSYIAYDTEDRPEAAVALRVKQHETPACESTSAHKVWGDYYWVSIGC